MVLLKVEGHRTKKSILTWVLFDELFDSPLKSIRFIVNVFSVKKRYRRQFNYQEILLLEVKESLVFVNRLVFWFHSYLWLAEIDSHYSYSTEIGRAIVLLTHSGVIYCLFCCVYFYMGSKYMSCVWCLAQEKWKLSARHSLSNEFSSFKWLKQIEKNQYSALSQLEWSTIRIIRIRSSQCTLLGYEKI